MPIVTIDGKQVHVEDHDSAKFAAEYLSKNPDNAKDLIAAAHAQGVNGVAHFTVPNMHTNKDSTIVHHVSMIHKADGTYILEKTHGY